jgi:CRISPR-associated endonuclease/helicase Cas3
MIELELAPHYESLADPFAEDYALIANALGNPPLYHQWRTYKEKAADIVVNSYNTGTGKTNAALLRLLDLDAEFKRDRYVSANVLFIAPTNELLRQHEEDVRSFIEQNRLSHIVLRLDAATVRALGQQHLSEKFTRQGDRLNQMLQDPRSVLTDKDGFHIEGHRPYVLVINPDIFYYALYGLGNPHDQKVLFRAFIEKFNYIVVDEFHYYNAKQLANFLFLLALSREWGFFTRGRKVCLLTATPAQQVKHYLDQLHLQITYIEPSSESSDLPTTPALAPVHLRLYSAEALQNGLVSLASDEKATVLDWLRHQQHGAFISSALWRINQLYQEYGGKNNESLGRLTGAEQTLWREQNKLAHLLMATPTVDIGYNFTRPGKTRQSIDFLFFDAHSSDEFIQRLGRAGRVLGKQEFNTPSDVWAVVPDRLVTELNKLAGQNVTRSELNKSVNETLPQKNGIYAYISSGAIAEAFLPLYSINKSLPTEEKEKAEHLYKSIVQVYGDRNALSFRLLVGNTLRYLKIKARLPELLREANTQQFTFGPASIIVRTMDEQPDVDLDALDSIDETAAKTVEQKLLKSHKAGAAELKRLAEIEEYYITDARFNFRDNFQPPLALAHDPAGYLATAEYTTYSALHIVQNYIADWFDIDQPQFRESIERMGVTSDKQVKLCCEIRRPREQRLSIYFKLGGIELSKRKWEAHYCSKLAAAHGFRLHSDNGPVPSELNKIFEQNYITFYIVPAIGPEALALTNLYKTTSLFTNTLKVDFGNEGELEYMMVVGSAALLVSYEKSIIGAKYVVRRASTRGSHIFDWNEEA